MKKPYIVCSAIYVPNHIQYVHQPVNISHGIVVCGLRHCNCCVTLAQIFESFDYKNHRPIYGFLTSENQFVSRDDASVIALKAGQVDKVTDGLFSEDLY